MRRPGRSPAAWPANRRTGAASLLPRFGECAGLARPSPRHAAPLASRRLLDIRSRSHDVPEYRRAACGLIPTLPLPAAAFDSRRRLGPAGQTTAIIPSSEGCWAEPTIQGRNRRSLFPVDGTGGCLMTPQSNKGRAAAGRASGTSGQRPGLSSADAEQEGTPHAMDYQIADRARLRGYNSSATPMPSLAQGAYIQGPGFGVEVGRPGYYRDRYEDRYEDRGYRGYGYDRDRYRGGCRTVTIERDDGSVRRIRRCD
jgi:hypothetical protein